MTTTKQVPETVGKCKQQSTKSKRLASRAGSVTCSGDIVTTQSTGVWVFSCITTPNCRISCSASTFRSWVNVFLTPVEKQGKKILRENQAVGSNVMFSSQITSTHPPASLQLMPSGLWDPRDSCPFVLDSRSLIPG